MSRVSSCNVQEYMNLSETLEKFTSYQRDICTVRGAVKVLARKAPCDCMKSEKKRVKPMEKLWNCSNCYKEFPKGELYKCACHTVLYCSKECQREDWPSHRLLCKQTRKAKDSCEEMIEKFKIQSFLKKLK